MVVELLDHADLMPDLLGLLRGGLLADDDTRKRSEALDREAARRVELVREFDRIEARVTTRLPEQQHEPPEREHARRAADSLALLRVRRTEFIERGPRELEDLAGSSQYVSAHSLAPLLTH